MSTSTLNDKIGKATLNGPQFNITVECGTPALIRCYSVHKKDVAQWAMELFEGGRVGQAQVLFEMQVTPGEHSLGSGPIDVMLSI